MRSTGSLAATAALAVLVPLLPVPAHAAAPERCTVPPGQPQMGGEPWAQQVLNVKVAHRLTTGRGVKVAVVDSGVDFANPQLKGQGAGEGGGKRAIIWGQPPGPGHWS